MGILSFISDIFKPAAELIDECITSDEERLKLRNELAKIQAGISTKLIDLETKVAESAAKMAQAESKSDSAFTRMYRPVIITCMFLLLSANAFGILTVPLPDVFIQVFGIAFGITSAGRSVEKFKALGK